MKAVGCHHFFEKKKNIVIYAPLPILVLHIFEPVLLYYLHTFYTKQESE